MNHHELAHSWQHLDDEARKSATKFIELFYHAMDNKREVVSHMYKEHASMLWNGELVEGREQIREWLNRRLPASVHRIQFADVQRLPEEHCEGEEALLVQTGGTVQMVGRTIQFTQTFILHKQRTLTDEYGYNLMQGSKWMVVSDRYRSID